MFTFHTDHCLLFHWWHLCLPLDKPKIVFYWGSKASCDEWANALSKSEGCMWKVSISVMDCTIWVLGFLHSWPSGVQHVIYIHVSFSMREATFSCNLCWCTLLILLWSHNSIHFHSPMPYYGNTVQCCPDPSYNDSLTLWLWFWNLELYIWEVGVFWSLIFQILSYAIIFSEFIVVTIFVLCLCCFWFCLYRYHQHRTMWLHADCHPAQQFALLLFQK